MSPVRLIRDIGLFDGLASTTVPGQAVLVDNDRIAWVGPAGAAPPVPSAESITAPGFTLLPGLINAHVHLCHDGEPDLAAQSVRDTVPLATLRAARMASATLAAGITTVRDCGSANGIVLDIARAIADGSLVGPDVVAAGRVITMTGGHGHFIGREADGPDGVRAATRAELKEGAHFIKAMASGGVLTRGSTTNRTALLRDELDVIVQEAHNASRRVATHAIGNESIKNALRAGVDSIEHGFHLDDEALELAVATGAYLVPTLLATVRIAEEGAKHGAPAWIIEKATAERENSCASFIAAVNSGMKIAAGTDAGTPFNLHEDLPVELELMVQLGLAPAQALAAATRNAAENLDIAHKVGTVEVGKLADLILVAGDPACDISLLRDVSLVMKRGKIIRNLTSDVNCKGESR